MNVTVQALWLPKAGNTPAEYEDAFWPVAEGNVFDLPVRLAVGDGAAETLFSALWAKLLVEDYGLGLLTEKSLPERLRLLQDRWKTGVGSGPLPWYAEEKLRAGAFSSLVGVTLEPSDAQTQGAGGRWTAMAVGDSCLFQIRGEKLLEAFPLDRTEQFNNRPMLLPSASTGGEVLWDAIKVRDGYWEPGDDFYLMTDALACWFLRRLESLEENPLSLMKHLWTSSDFDKFVCDQRADKSVGGQPMLRNDDVTFMRCRIEGF